MGQKVHPYGFRLGYIRPWSSKWFAEKDYKEFLLQDINIRRRVKERLYSAGVPRIDIERFSGQIKLTIYTSRPGIIIGRKGSEVDKLKEDLERYSGRKVSINIKEVRKPELDAQLIGEMVAVQIEKRIAYRRAIKKSITAAMRFGALGIKIQCGGRLAGAEIARSEWYKEGSIPLHTIRADIDYGFAEAKTTYGRIGIKVWVYKGDIFPGQ